MDMRAEKRRAKESEHSGDGRDREREREKEEGGFSVSPGEQLAAAHSVPRLLNAQGSHSETLPEQHRYTLISQITEFHQQNGKEKAHIVPLCDFIYH
ncbi:hypothetical protein PAMP_023579 [Pampus punctatissimus]